MNKQEWTPIPSAPGYYASMDGRIISLRRKAPHLMKPIPSADGHLYIFVDKRKRWVHQLILETFVCARPDGLQCRHLDGNPGNNRIENLCWGTNQENSQDRYRHGTMPCGEKSSSAKLTPRQVAEIRAIDPVRNTSRAIASRYGVSHTTIQEIWRNERWINEQARP